MCFLLMMLGVLCLCSSVGCIFTMVIVSYAIALQKHRLETNNYDEAEKRKVVNVILEAIRFGTKLGIASLCLSLLGAGMLAYLVLKY